MKRSAISRLACAGLVSVLLLLSAPLSFASETEALMARIWLDKIMSPSTAMDGAKSHSAGTASSGTIRVTDVVANCYVANFGQTVTSFEITVDDPDAVKELAPEDFAIKNAVVTFEYGLLEENSARSVVVDSGKILLKVDEFLLYKSGGEGPLEGKPLAVECRTDSVDFSFTFADITAKTEIIDTFAYGTFDGMEYYLYTPDDTSSPQPIMVYLHGNAMAGIQLQFARATSWFASPEVQEKQQAYVFAPTSMLNKAGESGWNSDEIDLVVKFIEGMIAEGRVDKNRVYIQGNSMGGMGTMRAIQMYPGLFAAAMPMCGTVMNTGDNRSVFQSRAKDILHMPIWILHARNDTLVKLEDTKYVYDTLLNMGADRLKATWVEDEVLARYGIYFAHAADIVSTYMPEVADWFFEQHK